MEPWAPNKPLFDVHARVLGGVGLICLATNALGIDFDQDTVLAERRLHHPLGLEVDESQSISAECRALTLSYLRRNFYLQHKILEPIFSLHIQLQKRPNLRA